MGLETLNFVVFVVFAVFVVFVALYTWEIKFLYGTFNSFKHGRCESAMARMILFANVFSQFNVFS